MIMRPSWILGGLPIVADISWGKDADTPNGPGEYWSDVGAIYWRKRDGSAGKEIPDHIRDRAEKYDPYFSALIEHVESELAYEAWLDEQKNGKQEVVKFTLPTPPEVK